MSSRIDLVSTRTFVHIRLRLFRERRPLSICITDHPDIEHLWTNNSMPAGALDRARSAAIEGPRRDASSETQRGRIGPRSERMQAIRVERRRESGYVREKAREKERERGEGLGEWYMERKRERGHSVPTPAAHAPSILAPRGPPRLPPQVIGSLALPHSSLLPPHRIERMLLSSFFCRLSYLLLPHWLFSLPPDYPLSLSLSLSCPRSPTLFFFLTFSVSRSSLQTSAYRFKCGRLLLFLSATFFHHTSRPRTIFVSTTCLSGATRRDV